MTADARMTPRLVHIALGANLGDRLATLGAALERLDAAPEVRVVRVSSAYETDAIGPPQPPYLNAAAALATTLTAAALLAVLLQVERHLGRDRSRETRWGPRTIDLDLLLDGESVCAAPGLAVPHPRMAERAFVLVPLSEIAPRVRDPRSGALVEELLAALATTQPAQTTDASLTGRIARIGPIPFRPRSQPPSTQT